MSTPIIRAFSSAIFSNDANLEAVEYQAERDRELTEASWVAHREVLWIDYLDLSLTDANSIYMDIQALFIDIVEQSEAKVDQDSHLFLSMSPHLLRALSVTNKHGVTVASLLHHNFPNLVTEFLNIETKDRGVVNLRAVRPLSLDDHPIFRRLRAFNSKMEGK